MQRTYRERKYYCGEYMEVVIFPVYTHAKKRSKRKKPTSEIQQRLNRRHSEGKLRRLLHTNFSYMDTFATLTFDDAHLPASVEDAQRLLQNFLRRVKRRYGKLGIDPKYIYVLEYGTKHNRLHIHLVISGGLNKDELTKLRGLGQYFLPASAHRCSGRFSYPWAHSAAGIPPPHIPWNRSAPPSSASPVSSPSILSDCSRSSPSAKQI